MNILIISECYTKGGLETHILTMYNALKHGNKIYFAFANYIDNGYFSKENVYDNFSFSKNSTIEDFISDVNRLVSIIKNKKIDVINIHPFYSFYPAVFAATITNTKIVYTCHGPGSITMYDLGTPNILFDYFIKNCISSVLAVKKSLVEYFKNNYVDSYFFPNSIDSTAYTKRNFVNNKKWAFVSRLSKDKMIEIYKLINNMDKYGIKKLDIYGDGDCYISLNEFLLSNDLISKVTLVGHCENLNERLNGYNGIIGMGRCALEGLVMNYPVILAGCGKVIGLIDENNYSELKDNNFVPNDILEKHDSIIIKEIKNINEQKCDSLRAKVLEEFDSKNIATLFIEVINNTKVKKDSFVLYIFNELQKFDNTLKIYESYDVFNLIYETLLLRRVDYINNINMVYAKRLIEDKIKIDNLYYNIELLKGEILEIKSNKKKKFFCRRDE